MDDVGCLVALGVQRTLKLASRTVDPYSECGCAAPHDACRDAMIKAVPCDQHQCFAVAFGERRESQSELRLGLRVAWRVRVVLGGEPRVKGAAPRVASHMV